MRSLSEKSARINFSLLRKVEGYSMITSTWNKQRPQSTHGMDYLPDAGVMRLLECCDVHLQPSCDPIASHDEILGESHHPHKLTRLQNRSGITS